MSKKPKLSNAAESLLVLKEIRDLLRDDPRRVCIHGFTKYSNNCKVCYT